MERDILAKTHFHRCQIYGKKLVVQEDGSTKEVAVLVHEDVPCSLSKRNLKDMEVLSDRSLAPASFLLFVSDLIAIQPGMQVVIAGDRYIAGKGMAYEGSHAEVPLFQSKIAGGDSRGI